MNKIYFISCYFAPIGRAEANRAFLVKYLAEEGWDIEVVAGERFRSFILNFQEDHSLRDVIPKGIKIHHFNGRRGWLVYDFKKLLNKPNNVRDHWINEAEKNHQLEEKGIIYAVIPPIDYAILAYRLALKFNYPLVLYYVDDSLDIDKKIIERANIILTVTSFIKDALLKKYGHREIHVVEHGFLQDIPLTPKSKVNFPLRLIYTGSMTFRTRPEVFAMGYNILLRKNPKLAEQIEIDFYGPQNYYHFLFLNKWLNRNVRFKRFLSVKELFQILPTYDMALASTKGNVAFPSKIYQYLNAGLPLLTASDHHGSKEFVEKHQIGLASLSNAQDVANKIEELVQNKDQIIQWRKNVIKIKSEFSLNKRVEEISQLLKTI